MSIITFMNIDRKETGQTISCASLASCMSIEHNYKSLLISTDFRDNTMERCFFNVNKKNNTLNNVMSGMTRNPNSVDVSNGLEGLVRAFASNRASADLIKTYTRPILNGRLDLLVSPKTIDIKEYAQISTYFSQIADVANKVYDIVFIDLNSNIPKENQAKLMSLSDVIVIGLTQRQDGITDFYRLKEKNEFYRKSNVVLMVGKYNPESKFTGKNISRYLNEKDLPLLVPYNVTLADYSDEGKMIDYLLNVQKLSFQEGNDGFFYSEVKKSAERLDYIRQAVILGTNVK